MLFLFRILSILILLVTVTSAQVSEELEKAYATKENDTVWVNKILLLTADELSKNLKGTIGYISTTREIAKKLKHQKGVFEATIQISEYYRYTRQLDSADRFIKELIELGDRLGEPALRCRAMIAKGLLLSAKGRSKDAIDVYNEAVSIIDTSKHQKLYAALLTNRANDRSKVDQSEGAVHDYIEAATIFEKTGELASLAITLNNIALELGRLGRYRDAVDYYDRAIEINEKIQNYHDLALCYSNAASSLRSLGLLDTALVYCKKAIEIALKRGFNFTLAQSYMNAGSIYESKKDPANAELWFKKSIEICYSEGIIYGLMVNMSALGGLYDKSGQTMKAIAHYDSALKYAEKLESRSDINDIHGKLAVVLAKAGDYKQAYKYLRLFHDYSDSVKGGETAAKIVELDKKYQTEKQAAEIARLEQLSSNQLLIIISLIAVAAASISIIFFFRYKRKKAEEAEIKAARHAKEIEKFSEELKELNATKDKLFSLISHDIRGPFTPILLYSEELAANVDNLSRDEIAQMSSDINSAAATNYFLISNLLDWARTQTGRIQFNPENLHLAELIADVRRNLSFAFRSKNINLEVEIPHDTVIMGDRTMVNSIFQNIIQNAIKFSGDGSEIRVRGHLEGNMIRISISDNGTGMSKETAGSLFGTAGVTPGRGTKNEGGTGLGMSISADFVERHSGSISVESTVGKGTTVTFTLPVAETAV
ncbi:MAG: tetratricopeptide repeat-containing sensor histidine kinase [Bacteroidetes bacterium]|nr:tetratricopeptide repeat-containing sensor histidine kinase [Bacteroidota bacterium]